MTLWEPLEFVSLIVQIFPIFIVNKETIETTIIEEEKFIAGELSVVVDVVVIVLVVLVVLIVLVVLVLDVVVVAVVLVI